MFKIMSNFKGYLKDKDGNKIYPDDYDTGWQTLSLASNIQMTSASNYPARQRKVGNIVYLEGLIELVSEDASVDIQLGTVKWPPSKTQYCAGVTSMAEDLYSNKAKVVRINTNGTIQTHGSNISISRWISLYGISYFVD